MSKIAILGKLSAKPGKRGELLESHHTSDALRAVGPKLEGLIGGNVEITRLEPRGGKGSTLRLAGSVRRQASTIEPAPG